MCTTTRVYPARRFTSAAGGSLRISRSWTSCTGPGRARLGRRSGCGVPQVAGHAHQPGGDLQVETAFLAALAISDNGQQMRSVTTRGSWPGWRSPGSSAGQAWIETLFGHVKGEWPHLEKIRDPGELDRVQAEYNSVRLHAAMGYVTRTTSTKAEARRSDPAATGSPRRGWAASHTVGTQPVTASRPWLGITSAPWLIKSDTSHIGRRFLRGWPTGRGNDQ